VFSSLSEAAARRIHHEVSATMRSNLLWGHSCFEVRPDRQGYPAVADTPRFRWISAVGSDKVGLGLPPEALEGQHDHPGLGNLGVEDVVSLAVEVGFHRRERAL